MLTDFFNPKTNGKARLPIDTNHPNKAKIAKTDPPRRSKRPAVASRSSTCCDTPPAANTCPSARASISRADARAHINPFRHTPLAFAPLAHDPTDARACGRDASSYDARNNPRIMTILYYLNGKGATWFPLADSPDGASFASRR